MSLIGPRPLPVTLEDFAVEERRRLLVRPGMTGLWQVSGRSRLTYDEMVELDLLYAERASLLLNLGILLRTIPALLRRETA
jgi:lipopolysaccharide/colanic/teichoic acid biosynthesis glycosyltransferase